MKPPVFLKGGEEVKLGIDKLGEQNHKVKPYKERIDMYDKFGQFINGKWQKSSGGGNL